MYIWKVTLEANDRGKGTGRTVNLGLYDSEEKAHNAVKGSLIEEGYDPDQFNWQKALKITTLRQNADKSVNRSYVWSVKRLLVK